MVGRVSLVLREILQALRADDRTPDQDALAEWWKQINEWRSMDCLKYDRNSDVIKPQYVLETLYDVTQGDAYVTSDVGQHQMWTSQFYHFDKNWHRHNLDSY